MPRHSLADRGFFCAIAILFLILGVFLVVDSIKNKGFGFGYSFHVLMLAFLTILGLIRFMRGQGDENLDDQTQVEEL
jgi:hypothetical protein